MAKRTSEENFKRIGELSFNREDVLGKGSYGIVYQGKYKDTIDVAIKRIVKEEFNKFEEEIFLRIGNHPNIVRFYHVEKDEDFMYYLLRISYHIKRF